MHGMWFNGLRANLKAFLGELLMVDWKSEFTFWRDKIDFGLSKFCERYEELFHEPLYCGLCLKIAENILEPIVKSRLAIGHKPRTVIATVVHIGAVLSGEKIPLREVAKSASVSYSTVKNLYRKLTKNLVFKVYL
jgi:hypothetical protein